MSIIAKDDSLQIEKLELGAFGTNTYLVVCKATGDSVVVDAPAEAGRILEGLKGTNPRYILITHSHFDHLGALSELQSRLIIPVAAHPLDAGGLPVATELLLNDGDTVSFGNIQIKVLHTPGHTPESLCFLAGRYLISMTL